MTVCLHPIVCASAVRCQTAQRAAAGVWVTARVRVVYVFVVLEVGTRRIVRWNVTERPTADWTIQQFRTVMTAETSRFVFHDREGIYGRR